MRSSVLKVQCILLRKKLVYINFFERFLNSLLGLVFDERSNSSLALIDYNVGDPFRKPVEDD